MTWYNSGVFTTDPRDNVLRFAEVFYAWNERRELLLLSPTSLSVFTGSVTYPEPADMNPYALWDIYAPLKALREDIETQCDAGKFYTSSGTALNWTTAKAAAGISGWTALEGCSHFNADVWSELYAALAVLKVLRLTARTVLSYGIPTQGTRCSSTYATANAAWAARYDVPDFTGVDAFWSMAYGVGMYGSAKRRPSPGVARVEMGDALLPPAVVAALNIVKAVRGYSAQNESDIAVEFSDGGSSSEVVPANTTGHTFTLDDTDWAATSRVNAAVEWGLTLDTSEPATSPFFGGGAANDSRIVQAAVSKATTEFYCDITPVLTYG